MMFKQEELKENGYLSETIDLIKQTISKQKKEIEEYELDNLKMQEYIWENIKDLDKGEMMFFNQMFNVNNSISKMNKLKNIVLKEMEKSPYFGRIDFIEKGSVDKDSVLKVYVGIDNLMDQNMNIKVYDWRAPVSSLYYGSETGECSYASPIGEIKGEILLKRQYKIEDGKLIYFANSSLAISDEYLLEVLSSNRGEKMSQIVSTIQQEQDLVIRNYADRVLLVEGPAGCGKTSVALHHIAYLLYRNRKSLASENILVFSPNEIFSNYISDVLPSLGERNILQTEFSKFIKTYLNEFRGIETYDKYLERLSNLSDNDIEKIKIKLDKRLLRLIDEYVEGLSKKVVFNDFVIEDNLFLKGEEAFSLMNKKFKEWPLMKRINKTLDYIAMKIKHGANKKINKIELEEYLKSRVNFEFDFKQIAIDMYCDEKFKQKVINAFGNEFENTSFGFDKKINYEDSIVLLYLRGKLYGFGYDNNIKHVVIDEAQDYTWAQIYILKEIFKEAFFTILGDQNQKLNAAAFDDFNDFNDLFSDYGPKRISLQTTYRSSQEITNFCNNILGLKNVNPIKRKGDEPEVYGFENDGQKIEFLKQYIDGEIEEGYNKISVIVKDKKTSKKLNSILKDKVNENIVVLPVYIAKGLEFDSVIVWGDNFSKNEYYVACSRALHRLMVLK